VEDNASTVSKFAKPGGNLIGILLHCAYLLVLGVFLLIIISLNRSTSIGYPIKFLLDHGNIQGYNIVGKRDGYERRESTMMRRTKPPATTTVFKRTKFPMTRPPKNPHDMPEVGDVVQVWLDEVGWMGRIGRVIQERRRRSGRREILVRFGTGEKRWIDPDVLRASGKPGIGIVIVPPK